MRPHVWTREALVWSRRKRPFPYPVPIKAGALALLWLVGGLVSLVATVLPHAAGMHVGLVVFIGVAGPLIGAQTWFFRRQLPTWSYPPLLATGTVMLTILVYAVGVDSAATFSFFYMWIVMYAVLIFTPLIAGVEIVLAALGYGLICYEFGLGPKSGIRGIEPVVLVAVIAMTTGVVVAMSRARAGSEIDPLTGVANRRGLQRLLDLALADTQCTGRSLVIAMIDVDNFKLINDEQGHLAGDRLLEQLVAAWVSMLRVGDSLARFGGDEFVILLPDTAAHEAIQVLDRLRLAAESTVTCSVGATTWHHNASGSMLISQADSALYQAKRLGRNRTVLA
jgi:diguanylate cyclase (GGDEF)-like protein